MPDDSLVDPSEGDFAAAFEPGPEPEQALVLEEADPALAFPDEFKKPFEGLLYIGKLSDTFDWLGHRFVIRTLVTDEVLEVGLVSSRYTGSAGESWAYMTATVAACLVTIDGQPLPFPIIDTGASQVEQRFNWVRQRMYQPAIEKIYERFLVLQTKVDSVIEAMGKA
mgnify:CR=1 FL=1